MAKIQFNYCNYPNKKKSIYNNLSAVFEKSFDQTYNKNIFKWKYLNINTSESIIQEILIDEKAIGYRGLWKIKNYPNAYQCIDTCILPNYQGKGIFKLSNQHLIDNIGSFYNYPNQISKPGYLKSGWEEISKMDIYLNKLENFYEKEWFKWYEVVNPKAKKMLIIILEVVLLWIVRNNI